jgi:hypothetical protein
MTGGRVRARAGGLLAIGLTAGLLGGGAAQAVGGADEVPDGTYQFVAKVSFGDALSCTGALVDSRWIVTAKDCFVDAGRPVIAGPPVQPTSVLVGRTDLTGTAGHRLVVTSLTPHPDRNLVLAELSAPVLDIVPVALGGAAPAPGEVLRVAGYGRTATEWVPDRLHAGSFTVQDVAGSSFGVGGSNWSESAVPPGRRAA